MDEIIERHIALPIHINAVTVTDVNGDYNIYINSLLSPTAKKTALQHELIHIKEAHFYNGKSAVENEAIINEKLR